MSSPSFQKFTAIVNVVVFVVMITTNCLSIFLPLNGVTQMQLSEKYANLFTPAGFTFSIWSIIYLLLFGFIIYQMYVLFVTRHADKNRILSISFLFVGVCLCNAAWLFAWHYEQTTLSVCIMLLHLIFLIVINEKLRLSISWNPLAPKIWLDIPFSLYLGWICVATIANISAWCVDKRFNLSFLSPQLWTIIMIVIALLLGTFYVFTRNNKFLALVICWALYGIISKRKTAPIEGSHPIIIAAEIALAVLFIIIIANTLRKRSLEEEGNMSA